MIIGAIASSFNNLPSTLLTSLIAAYNLDESSGNAVDIINGNNGTVTGVTYSIPGKQGMAYQFAGTGGITLPNSTPFIFGTASFSINIWIYLTSLGGTGINTVLFSGQSNSFSLVIQGADASLRCQKTNVAASGQSTSLLALNQWQMITVTLDGSSHALTYYINGSSAGTSTFNQNFAGASNLIATGPGMTTPTGIIDMPYYWNKVLSTGELYQLFNSGAGKTHPF